MPETWALSGVLNICAFLSTIEEDLQKCYKVLLWQIAAVTYAEV